MWFRKSKYPKDFNDALSGYNKIRKKEHRGKVCHAPYFTLRFTVNGKIYACCHNRYFALGSYPENSIKEVWTGVRMQEFRKKLNENILSVGCHACYKAIANQAYYNVYARYYDTDVSEKKQFYPARMEFALSNQCNLECIMCDGENSSKVRTIRECKENYPAFYDDAFVQQLDEFIPHLDHTIFSGGEPFLNPMYYKIWDKIVAVNPKTRIYIQTNGTIMSERILKLFRQGNVHISFSIDSIRKDTYESIRKGASFDTLMKNFNLVYDMTLQLNREMSIGFCPLKQNADEFSEIFTFFNNKNLPLTIHNVVVPPENTINTLSVEKLTEVRLALEQTTFVANTEIQKTNNIQIQSFIAYINGVIRHKITEEKDLPTLTENDLRKRLLENIGSYIAMAAMDIKLNTLYAERIDILLSEIDNTEGRKKALYKLCAIPVGYIVSELNANDFDKQKQHFINLSHF
jgi:MoaA/NifB/PqqE/SkfB family radical SAM enzyme